MAFFEKASPAILIGADKKFLSAVSAQVNSKIIVARKTSSAALHRTCKQWFCNRCVRTPWQPLAAWQPAPPVFGWTSRQYRISKSRRPDRPAAPPALNATAPLCQQARLSPSVLCAYTWCCNSKHGYPSCFRLREQKPVGQQSHPFLHRRWQGCQRPGAIRQALQWSRGRLLDSQRKMPATVTRPHPQGRR